MNFRNLWLLANLLGFVYGFFLSLSHPENINTVFVLMQSLTIGTYAAISTYKIAALAMAGASIVGAFYFGYMAGGKQNEKPQPWLVLPSILMAIVGINAFFYPMGSRLLFEVLGFFYIAFELTMLNIGGIYWLIHDIEENPRIRRKLRISF